MAKLETLRSPVAEVEFEPTNSKRKRSPSSPTAREKMTTLAMGVEIPEASNRDRSWSLLRWVTISDSEPRQSRT